MLSTSSLKNQACLAERMPHQWPKRKRNQKKKYWILFFWNEEVDDDYLTFIRVIPTEGEKLPCHTEECHKDAAVSWASNSNTNRIRNFCEEFQVIKKEVGPMKLFQSKHRSPALKLNNRSRRKLMTTLKLNHPLRLLRSIYSTSVLMIFLSFVYHCLTKWYLGNYKISACRWLDCVTPLQWTIVTWCLPWNQVLFSNDWKEYQWVQIIDWWALQAFGCNGNHTEIERLSS